MLLLFDYFPINRIWIYFWREYNKIIDVGENVFKNTKLISNMLEWVTVGTHI